MSGISIYFIISPQLEIFPLKKEQFVKELKILYKIFEYLNLNDLLATSKVCRQFRIIIMDILKSQYKEVDTYKINDFYIVQYNMETILNTKIEKKVILNSKEFWEFLNLQANNIEIFKLNVKGEFEKEIFAKFQFPNIKVLYCSNIQLKTGDFQSLQNMTKLEVLSLTDVCFENNNLLSELLNLKSKTKLKSLVLTNTKEYNINFLENLIFQLKLEICVINSRINSNNTEQSNQELENQKFTPCKELKIGEFVCENSFQIFHNNILLNMNNLTKLSLVSTNSFLLFQGFFKSLAASTPNLISLNMERFNVQEFTAILTLKELELNYCLGFSWNDLKTILSLMNLETFTSHATRYPGTFEFFDIALSLKRISLQYNIVNKIKTLFAMNQERLKNIQLLNWSVDQAKHLWINAVNCPNLEILIAKPRNLIFECLNEFKFLNHLTLNMDCADIKISDILRVLKHSNLKSFKINANDYGWLMDSGDEWINLKTNILDIQLKWHKSLTPFLYVWLALLDSNGNLSIKLCDLKESLCLKLILWKRVFPRRLETVNICGYTVGNYINIIKKNLTFNINSSKITNFYIC